MKKKIKEIIESAVPATNTVYTDIWLVDSEKKYDGFWGENGYNDIIILGKNRFLDEPKLELIADGVNTECDVFVLEPEDKRMIHIDIKHDDGMLHIFCDGGFKLQTPVISSCSVKVGYREPIDTSW